MSVELLEPVVDDRQVDEPSEFDGCGVLAEFAGPDELVSAARRMREAGYTKTDAFSPFPIHGIDEALGVKPTVLPWFALVVGLGGGAAALAMQWWMNAVDYPFLISGKPMFSLPANIPVTFEVIILSAAFAVFLGMLGLNRLPRLANPLLENERFLKATRDGFFLYVESADPQFDESAVRSHFQASGATHLEAVQPSQSSGRLPRAIYAAGALSLALAAVPPAMIFWARNTTSEVPRIDFFADMDSQRSFKAQEATTLFADGRAMRPQVEGTVAVGDLEDDAGFYRGLKEDDPQQVVLLDEEGAGKDGKAEAAAPNPDAKYISEFPVSVSQSLMRRGRMKYDTYCAPCHGLGGQGDGLVSLRAIELQESTWVPPTNLTTSVVAAQPVGKLFETISNGRRKMGGYAAQIEPKDRWAIVLYLRALQRSRNATIEDVPEDKAAVLEAMK